MKGMPKDETIQKWIKSSKSKKTFEGEMLRRLRSIELCGETVASSYISCHSIRFCEDIPFE